MQRTLDIVFNPITDDLYNESKAIKRTLGEVSDQAKATAKSIDQLDESIDSAAASTKKMGSAGSGVSNALKDTENQAKKLTDKYKDLGDKAGDVGARTGQLKGVLSGFGSGASQAAGTVMDLADAGEALFKSFAALGPVALVIGVAIAAAGAAYSAYSREQDQAKESTEQMTQAFEALDTAQRNQRLSLIQMKEQRGEISSLEADYLAAQEELETKTQDATRAFNEANEERIKEIATNKAWADTVRDMGGQVGIAADQFFGWTDKAEHLQAMFDRDAESLAALGKQYQQNALDQREHAEWLDKWNNEQWAKSENERIQREKEAKARQAQAKREAKQREEEAKAAKEASEAKKEEAEAEKQRLEAEKEREKVLDIQRESIENTKELSALVDGFYDPIIEGEDQWEAGVRKVKAEQEALNKQLTEQAAINVANGISNEEILNQKVELEKAAAAKIERIWADKAEADKKAADKELSISEMTARKIVNIRKKQGKEVSETAEEEKKEQLEAAGEVLVAVVEGISEIGQAMQGYLSETTDALNEIDELQAELSDKEIDASQLKGDALVEAYKNGEVAAEDLSESQKRFLGTVLKADEEALKKKEKRQRAVAMAGFVTDKAAAISAVVFNTAEAVTKALAKLGPIAGGAAAGALIAIAGAQTALIAAEKPSFASGVANYRPDAVDATLHKGESVLNTRATRMLGEDQVNQLNQGRSMGGTTDITSAIFLNDRLFEAQSVKARMKYGTEMNKASRKNRIGISSKRRG